MNGSKVIKLDKKAAGKKTAQKTTQKTSQKTAQKKTAQNKTTQKKTAGKPAVQKKKKPAKRKRSAFGTGVKVALSLIMLVMLGVVAMVFFKYKDDISAWQQEAKQKVEASSRSDFRPLNISYIYDKDGNQIAELSASEKNIYLRYEDIPQDAVNAFIAVEDRNFWTNRGYDLKGIFRVAVTYLKSKGSVIHGASTITQQLARKIYLTNEVSIARKVKEIMIATELTKKYTKKQIMEFYVNNCCFANNIYGIEAAADAYFRIPASELSLSQAAYLCAIPNRPTYYNPYTDPERAIERRDKILQDMHECGYISESALSEALSEEITVSEPKRNSSDRVNNYQTTYALHCAVKYMMQDEGFTFQYDFDSEEAYKSYQEQYDAWYSDVRDRIYTGGYKIYTSLDSEAQNSLQSIIDNGLNMDVSIGSSGMYDFQGALTAIDNQTGKVLAIVGGRSQEGFLNTYTLNRAYQSHRQPGSTIKPLVVYTPALMQGYTENSTLNNIDVSVAKNSKTVSTMSGSPYSLRSAVEQSKNGCAYQLFNDIGAEYGLSFIKAMNFDKIVPQDETLSASLGGLTYGATTEQMAGAYAAIENHGSFRDTSCITSIRDLDGKELYLEPLEKEAYSPEAADKMVDMLKGVISRGTASSMGWSSASKVEAAGKTGTTNDSKDGWFCGITPYFTVAVWVGFDTPKTLNNLYGATYPASIWKDSMLYLLDSYGYETGSFEKADGTDSDPGAYANEEFLPGRADDEVLSEGYTVADYRRDREIGKQIQSVIAQMNGLDPGAGDYQAQKDELYRQGQAQIESIYSRKYTQEMQQALDGAYGGGAQ